MPSMLWRNLMRELSAACPLPLGSQAGPGASVSMTPSGVRLGLRVSDEGQW